MKRTWSVIAIFLASTSIVLGQAPFPQVTDPSPPLMKLGSPISTEGFDGPSRQEGCDTNFRCWGSVEYLLWRAKSSALPPMVTQGNPNDPTPGALGQPGTQVLFGGNGGAYGNLNGLRVTVGGWFQKDLGWEASGFLFQRQSVGFSAASDANGNPSLYFPFFRPDLQREGSIAISDSLRGQLGNVTIVSQSQLWGAETNFLFNVGPQNVGWNLTLLAGLRYLDLQEGVYTSSNLNTPAIDVQNAINESFATRSQFYGGQIGARLGTQWQKLSVDLTAKVALGNTHQSVAIHGTDTQTGTGAVNGTFNEGIFAQQSNIGRHTANEFTVVPQTQVKLGYDLFPWLRATCTYDVLYWSRVVRANEQIDRNVDLTQSSVFGPGGSAASPGSQIHRSGYWAQGVGFGLEIRY